MVGIKSVVFLINICFLLAAEYSIAKKEVGPKLQQDKSGGSDEVVAGPEYYEQYDDGPCNSGICGMKY
jgi:hypothetical protein